MRRSPALVAVVLAAALAACGPKRWEPPPCPAGQTRCAGACVDVATSLRNCGACGNACLVNSTCTGGVCSACPADRPDACGSVGPGGLCTNLQTGVDGFCGTCGLSCAGAGVTGTDATCTSGACVCSGAAIDCGGNPRCVNAQTDPRNCGTCGNACPLAGEICSAGGCACPPTAKDVCSGRCVNLATDAKNCGTCGFACPVAGQTCSAGTCGCPASAPTICGNTCTSTVDDEKNCGTCGHACAAGQVCNAGKCTGCPTATPNACGSQCCAATFCCNGGTSCPTPRSNDLSGTFDSCDPPGTWSATSAHDAAVAWDATGTAATDPFCGGPGLCLAWQTSKACTVWCFDGAQRGLVNLNVISVACICPTIPPLSSTVTW